jgi:DNA-binding NtrC family response regulator
MSDQNPDEVLYAFDKVVTLDELERKHIATAMFRAGNNKPAAAAMLGITVKTLYNKLNRYEKEEQEQENGKQS